MDIRELKSSDKSEIDKILSLHNSTYKENRTHKQWLWEYKSNYPELFVFSVIEDDRRIVGSQAMIPIYININGKKYLSGKSENSLLDPKYRGRSLFENLYEFAMLKCYERKMCCVWGYTSAVRVWRNKLGFSVFDTLYESTLVLNLQHTFSEINKSNWKMRKKIKTYFFAVLGYVYSFKRVFRRAKKRYSIENKLRSIDDLDKLYTDLRKKSPKLIHISQDMKYINWRIYNNPNIEYETYFLYENNKLKGYCYAGIKNKTVSLTDFTFENVEAGTFLLSHLLKKWKKDIGFVLFFGNISNPLIYNIFNLLKQFGFVKRKHSNAIVIKNIRYKSESILYDVKNWYMNKLWTEGFHIR